MLRRPDSKPEQEGCSPGSLPGLPSPRRVNRAIPAQSELPFTALAEPQTTDDLETYAARMLVELVSRFPIGYVPALVWRALRVTAGSADYRRRQITLSRKLLTDRERLRVTMTHEYAHLLAVARHGPRAAGHGPQWKQAMVDLGLDPIRTHDYPVERNSPRQEVAYRCGKCGQLLVRKRRLPKRRRFVHVGCGGVIRFESAREVPPQPA